MIILEKDNYIVEKIIKNNKPHMVIRRKNDSSYS